ncbi:MAG: hypothetical protein OXT65_03155, partial [Alphaproteobacteria bacterium]|nr:hypothetical protein [Alphaproteobacteria bacterium]
CFFLLPAYYLTQQEKTRRSIMTLAGMWLVQFISIRLLVFYTLFWLVVTILQNHIARREAAGRATGLDISLFLVLLPMLAWKIMGDDFTWVVNDGLSTLLSYISAPLWEIDMTRSLAVTVGLSFATFRALDLLIKTHIGKISALTLDRVLFYGFFPPIQVTGPITEYEDLQKQNAKPCPQNITDGLMRIGIGAVKCFGLASLLQNNAGIFTSPDSLSVGELWLRLIAYSWYFYLNFAGYADIAIGTGKMFGFRMKENFNFPFFQQNIRDFWNNWHMTLSHWAQRNVFVPAGGYRKEKQYFAIALTILVIALWHDISPGMIVFAAWHFVALALHRKFGDKLPNHHQWQKICWIALTYLTVLLSFPLLSADLESALVFYQHLFGVGT